MYKKIIQNEMYNDNKMSLGFRRFICLPQKWQFNIQQTCVLKGITAYHDYIVAYFQSMMESDYEDFVNNKRNIVINKKWEVE